MTLDEAEKSLIFKCVAGSHMYGLANESSDTDTRGIFILPVPHYLSLNSKVEIVSDCANDIVYYTLKRFLDLATVGNPNILELLFSPEDCVLHSTDCFKELQEHRDLFVTKTVLKQYVSYAVAQIKKAKGKNKLVNNPQPEEKPVKENFCWITPHQSTSEHGILWPARIADLPDELRELYDLSKYQATAVKHCNCLYRLYHYGDNSKGVFRGEDTLVCEPLSMEEALTRHKAIMFYDKDAYTKALKNWHAYWEWVNKRNPDRWIDQENGVKDYDQKNMSHCLRLLYDAENILNTGKPIVRFTGDKLDKLLQIRYGNLPYEDILQEAQSLAEKLDTARRHNCSLPATSDLSKVSDLSIHLHNTYSNS